MHKGRESVCLLTLYLSNLVFSSSSSFFFSSSFVFSLHPERGRECDGALHIRQDLTANNPADVLPSLAQPITIMRLVSTYSLPGCLTIDSAPYTMSMRMASCKPICDMRDHLQHTALSATGWLSVACTLRPTPKHQGMRPLPVRKGNKNCDKKIKISPLSSNNKKPVRPTLRISLLVRHPPGRLFFFYPTDAKLRPNHDMSQLKMVHETNFDFVPRQSRPWSE
ncbi:hypothetical protein IF1G_08191 [Cordyceps javanica]|uniref:Secreted protein n=1 Tax=Cordyceps javanica TaxID=43265 RepID=A0A545UTU1_9HYPO|nr:hypothetical protein IF1G_08191 [Cordyceps javanica]